MSILDIFKKKKEGIHITDIELYHPGQYSTEFYKTKGKLRANYVNDVLHGPFETFDERGNLLSKGKYLMGNLFGEVTLFHLNQDIKCKTQYDEFGKIIGTEYRYLPGNILTEEGSYCSCCSNDLQAKHGVWKEYDKKGRVIIEGVFNHGAKDGLFIRYKYIGNGKKAYKDYSILYEYDPDAPNWQLYEKVLEKKIYLKDGSVKKVKNLKENRGIAGWRYISDDDFDNLGQYLENGG